MIRSSSRRALYLISAGMCFTTMGLATLGLLVPLYGVEIGASPIAVGYLVAAAHMAPLALAIQAGGLIDRFGAVRVLLIGSLGLTAVPIIIVVSPSLVNLIVAQVLVGLSHMMLTLASQTLVSGFKGDRAANMGTFAAFLSVGQLIGPLLAGAVLDSTGFRIAFGIVAVTAVFNLVLGPILNWSVRQSPPRRSTRPRDSSPGLRVLVRVPGIQVAIFASSGIFAGTTVYQTFLPVLLDGRGMSATSIGVLLSIRSLAALVVRPALPLILRVLRGQHRVLVVALVFTAIGTGLSGFAAAPALLGVLALFVGVGMGIGIPLSIVAIASRSDPRDLGRLLGLRLSANRFAQLSAAIGIGAITGVAGFTSGFLITAASLLAMVGILASRSKASTRVNRTPNQTIE